MVPHEGVGDDGPYTKGLETRGQRGPVVKTVNMTAMVDKLGAEFGERVYEVAVGFKNVAPKMMETNALLGGEESGGFAVRGHIPERDGILIGLLFADMIVKTGKSVSQILAGLEQRVGPHAYARHDIHLPRETYDAGYRQINGYSPFPIEELSEAIGFRKSALPLIVLIGGVLGGLGGFFLQYWTEVIDYPINVGGKPFNSWPAFIPITFECTVLVAAFSAVLGMLALNKLPQPYHPVFNAPNFALATRDSFFLVIESKDPKFDHDAAVRFLKNLDPREVIDVEL